MENNDKQIMAMVDHEYQRLEALLNRLSKNAEEGMRLMHGENTNIVACTRWGAQAAKEIVEEHNIPPAPQYASMFLALPKIRLSGYVGTRQVFVNDQLLEPEQSLRLRRHSPDGFAWGYTGSAPAQLALALLLQWLPIPLAQSIYQTFKTLYIAPIPQDKDFDIELDLAECALRCVEYQTPDQ